MTTLEGLLGDAHFIQQLSEAILSGYALPFVAREEEVQALSKTLIRNSINAALKSTENPLYVLPYLPQISGSGKTTLGQNLLVQAKKHRAYLIERLVPTFAQSDAELVKCQVNKFLAAEYVRVSMVQPPAEISLQQAILGLMRSALNYPLAEAPNKKATISEQVLVLAKGRKIVFHFDDVGSILDPSYDKFFRDSDEGSLWETRRMCAFWEVISILNQMDGIYCFISSKHCAFISLAEKFLRRGQTQPPTSTQSITLKMFDPPHLRQIIDEISLWEIWGIDDEILKQKIVAALHGVTGGVPRLVSFAVKALRIGGNRIGNFLKQLDDEKFQPDLRELLYAVITFDKLNILRSDISSNPIAGEFYLHLLAISLRENWLDKNTKITFKDELMEIPLAVIVSELDCYVKQEHEGKWQLVFPELVLMWVAKNLSNRQLTFLASSVLADPGTRENRRSDIYSAYYLEGLKKLAKNNTFASLSCREITGSKA